MQPAPRRSEALAPNWSLELLCSIGFIKSAASKSTSAMYIKIPAEAELKIPSTIRAVGLFSSYTLEIPIPIAIPTGVVREKNVAIIAIDLDLNFAYNWIKIKQTVWVN